ncbi:MAG: membrane protein insertion efficiency factor YidD [Vampirovibrio sp.]
MSLAQRMLCVFIKGYQKGISPFLPRQCRFFPSCSCYALSVLERDGAVKGLWKTIKRLAKCHPWHAGGIDLP